MRILYLSPWFPYPLDNGSRIRVYHHLRALARRHEVTLVTLDPQGWAPARVEKVSPFCTQLEVVPKDPFRRGRLRSAIRFFSPRPMVNAPFPEMTRLVQRLHAERPFDAVIAVSTVMAAYALSLPRVPRILEEHNSHTRWMHDRYQAQSTALQRLRCLVSWRKSALYESHLFPHFDLVTMVSEQDAGVSRRLLPDGRPLVAVVPNGVDCAHFRPGMAEPQPDTLIFGGALTYAANYEAMHFFLHRVYPRIRSKRPGVSLRITGSTKGADLDVLPLDRGVILAGFVEDIRPLVAASWVAVVPILSGGGTRIKILEAMALGTPVVATPKGAEGLDVIHNHNILIADEPLDFATQVLRLLHDAALRRRLVTNARRLVEQSYDWSPIGQQFVHLIEKVVKDRSSGSLSDRRTCR